MVVVFWKTVSSGGSCDVIGQYLLKTIFFLLFFWETTKQRSDTASLFPILRRYLLFFCLSKFTYALEIFSVWEFGRLADGKPAYMRQSIVLFVCFSVDGTHFFVSENFFSVIYVPYYFVQLLFFSVSAFEE